MAGGRAVAVAGLWDQRAFKQVVVRGYSGAVAMARPAANLIGWVTRQPSLPRVGGALRSAYLCPLAARADDDLGAAVALVEALHAPAATAGIDCLIAGFDPREPLLRRLRRRFGGRELRTRLYVVHWPDGTADAAALDGRLLGPEVALL